MTTDITLKCYYVHNKVEPFGEFIFAETRGKAIYQSEAYWEAFDWLAIRAVRVPELDGKEITKENVEAAGYGWDDYDA